MDTSTGSISHNNSSSGLVDKLLPKSISDKRRRRKQRKTEGRHGDSEESSNLSRPSSQLDSENSSNIDHDHERDNDSFDGRSFGSFEPGPEPETSFAGSNKRKPASVSSRSPTRPGAVSVHPSQIGYLTTSSPIVQATHIDPESQPSISSQIDPAGSSQLSWHSQVPNDLPSLDTSAAPRAVSIDRPARASLNTAIKTPRTPPAGGHAAPAILQTPPTPTEQSSVFISPLDQLSPPAKVAGSNSRPNDSAPSRTVSGHQRSASASAALGPSKLSTTTFALTPTAEEPTTAAGTGGFFSSIVSAAQSAATNLSTNIQTSGISLGVNKSKASASTNANLNTTQTKPSVEVIVEAAPEAWDSKDMDKEESAVGTIGTGNLSLSHLGLADSPALVTSPASARFGDLVDTRARSESAPPDTPTSTGGFMPDGSTSRPRSLNEPGSEEQTPPPATGDLDGKSGGPQGPKTSAHVHRKRNSSVTTSGTTYTTVGAPLGANTTLTTQQSASGPIPDRKLTGFAIASKKRNRDFHTIFKSVPDDDYLIEDYSCALQREILAHGRLYVSEGHLCFSSNIFGWSNTLVMSFDEIVSVEKRSTALVFKNGLMITTLHSKHIFASFTSRDATYDLIVNIWKLGHPTLKSTLNGVQLEGTGGDKTEKVDGEGAGGAEGETQSGSASDVDSDDEEEEFYDEEDNDGSVAGNTAEPATGLADVEKSVTRKASAMTTNGASAAPAKDGAAGAPSAGADFPGPATHAPTDCGDAPSHYDKVVGDDIVPAPLGKVYSLMFGSASPAYMSKWLTVDQKCTELQMDDKVGLSLDNKTRTYNYIKPLYASIGPKQTKCIVSETVETLDYEKSANLIMSTQTPDVPSGNVFTVKTKYCLSWAENNSTRVQVNCTVEWSGKSWLKGPIEKGASDGQTQYCKDLFASLKTAVSTRARAGTGTNGNGKARKKGKKGKQAQASSEEAEKSAAPKKAEANWGPFEAIRPILEPVTDILQPIFGGNVMYGILVGLLAMSWFGIGFGPRKDATSYSGMHRSDRLAAYEEMWRREDTEMWEWLDERLGLANLNANGPDVRQKVMEPRSVQEKLDEQQRNLREIEEAIRVTEEKLRILREATAKTTSGETASPGPV